MRQKRKVSVTKENICSRSSRELIEKIMTDPKSLVNDREFKYAIGDVVSDRMMAPAKNAKSTFCKKR